MAAECCWLPVRALFATTRARVLLAGRWNVSLANTTQSLFTEAWLFNSSLADWDTARVVNMMDTYVPLPSHPADPPAHRLAQLLAGRERAAWAPARLARTTCVCYALTRAACIPARPLLAMCRAQVLRGAVL